jgi:hypothetical protein
VTVRKKLTVGAVLTALPVLAVAAPAAADTEDKGIVSETVTVQSGQVTHTCEFVGGVGFEYDEETDISWVTGSTYVTGDPFCWSGEFHIQSLLWLDWTEADGTRGHVERYGRGEDGEQNVSLSVPVRGEVTKVDGLHEWTYVLSGNNIVLSHQSSTK